MCFETNEFGNESKRLIQLVEKATSRTSRGMLSKAWYNIDGKLCMVKGNSEFNGVKGYEPYSEVMTYKIGRLMGLKCIEYWLEESKLFSEVTVIGLEHVCVSKNYIHRDEESLCLIDFIDNYTDYQGKNYWEDVIKGSFMEDDISDILILDFLTGNEDRHLGNIEIISHSSNGLYVSPIYDNGAGLLSWVSDEDLWKAKVPYVLDKSKPFRSKHKNQIKLVSKFRIALAVADLTYYDIIDEIREELSLLPKNRAVAIMEYIKWRFSYLRSLIECENYML